MKIFRNKYTQDLTTYLRTRYKGQESFENKVQEAVTQIQEIMEDQKKVKEAVESATALDQEIKAFLKKHENDEPWLRTLNAYTNFGARAKVLVT